MKPRLLLHICCGPCATEVVRRLQDDYELVGFFHNPNIFPEEEYYRRLVTVERLSALWHILVDVGEYDPERFREATRGLEDEPEGGRRCEACYRLRLEEAASRAAEHGCSVVASTLAIGPGKRAAVIDPIGYEVCGRHGVEFLAGDWKKGDGFRRSVEESKRLGLYRQHYCGCEASQPDRQSP